MLSLRKNLAYTLVGNVTYNLSQWGWLMVLAKLADKESIGIFALALAITAPVFLFSSMQLRSLYVTDAANTNKFADYLSLRSVLAVISFMFVTIYALTIITDIALRLTIIAIAFAKLIETTSDLFQGVFQKKNRMDIVSVSLILKGISSLVLFFLIMYLTGLVYWASWGIAFSWLLILVFYDIRKTLNLSYKRNGSLNIIKGSLLRFKKELRWDNRLLIMALPLGGVIGLISLNSNIPKYFISHYLGNEMLGVFAAVGYIVMVGRLVDISIGQTFAPQMAIYVKDKNRNGFLKLCGKYFIFGLIISILSALIVYLIGDILLAILYTKEFTQYNAIFFILIISNGIVWTFSFLNHSMIIFRNTNEQFLITIFTSIVLLFFCWILIPQSGLIGGAYALLIANLIAVPIKAIFFKINMAKM